MSKQLTKRSVVFLLIAVVWTAVISTLMFGLPVRVRAEEGKKCPQSEGNCYWTYCHKNYDGSGNVLSETCNGNKFQTSGPTCSEADCVSGDDFIE
jgi:hypothetical protein